MPEEAAASGKKGKPLKWYWVAAITLVVAFGLAYLFYPKTSITSKSDIKYDPITGAALDSTKVTTNPVDGTKFTS